MPIPNYQIPGVYVTQSGTALTAVNPTNLNIAIVADQVTPGYNTDTFSNVVSVSGSIIGQLTVPMVNITSTGAYSTYSGFSLTWTNSTGVTTTGTYGTNYQIVTPSGSAFSYLTTSGATSPNVYPSGTVQITYGHNWGAYNTYYEFNPLASTIGAAISGTTIINPATLAAQLAFQNGANSVTIVPVARVSSSGLGSSATVSDWVRTFQLTPSGNNGSDPTFLSSQSNVDVIVPLYGFISVTGTTAGQLLSYNNSAVATGITNYLTVQSGLGNYQRAFLGVDNTNNQVTVTGMQVLASGFGASTAGTRVSIVYPGSINYNPGLSLSTGLSNANFNVAGYYVAAALAGLFVGQTDVYVPITNKTVNGFNYIPNQISTNDAQYSYLAYGITTVYQNRNGLMTVLQGLTTNIQNWITQEISINAVGDRLANNIKNALVATQLIGGPLTQNTAAAALGTVQAVLTNSVSNGLIQSYQNLSYIIYPNSPTTINITFQYSPTYPLNYIQTVLSLNTQTGAVVTVNAQSNPVVY